MRNDIYRAKLKGSGQWIYWNMFGQITTATGKRHAFKKETSSGFSMFDNIEQIRQLVVTNTICRTTGLKDKTGKHIFEADICLFENDDNEISCYAVKYEPQKGRFIILERDKEYPVYPDDFDDFFAKRCQVICDIFNPEYAGYIV